MPKPRPNESRGDYISRCVQQVRHEEPGKPIKECLGKCYGMFKQYSSKGKVKSDGKES
jgi:hypothetical protein